MSNPDSFTAGASIATENDVQCFGGTAKLTATASVSGEYTFEVYESGTNDFIKEESGPHNGTEVEVSSGDYYVIAINEDDCASSNQAPVSTATPSEVVFISESSTSPTCLGEDDGTITVAATGRSGSGCSGCLYSIPTIGRGDQSSGLFESLQADIPYEVVVKDGNCTASTTITITPDPTPLSFTATPTSQRCSYTEDGQIAISNVQNALSGVITYRLEYPDASQITNATGTFQNLASGTYRVSISDGNCDTTFEPVIVGSPSPLTATFDMTPARCNGEENGTLMVNVGGGVPFSTGEPYTYLWEHDGSTSAELTAGAGLYTVTITDANGCILPDQMFEITEPFPLTADYEQTDITCHNANDGTITLIDINGGNGGNSYTWSDDPLINASSRTNLSGGSYSVTIEDTEGCQFTISDIEIMNPAALDLTIAAQEAVGCRGEATGSITLSLTGGVGGYEYRLDGGTYQSSNEFDNLLAGAYTLEARDVNNCTVTTSTTITEPLADLAVTLEEINATCDTDGRVTATVSGGTPPYQYEWRSTFPVDEILPDIGNEIIVPAGSYPLTVTDANGCEVAATGNLSSDDGAMITIVDQSQPSCSYISDGSATISLSGIAPFTTTWDHGESGESPLQLSIGDNWFNVVDANGCLVRDRVSFADPQPLEAAVTDMTLPSCNGTSDGTLTIEITGGNGNYTATWDNGQIGNTIRNLRAGSYEVTITDNNACELVTIFELPEKELLTIELLPVDPLCDDNSDGMITAIPSGGNGDYQYSWSNGGDTSMIDQLTAGTYTLTVTDALGCTAEAEVTLTDPPLTTFFVEDLAICSGQEYKLSAPVEALSYRWIGPEDFEVETREAVISVPGTYMLEVTDLINCPASASFEVVIDDEVLQADFLVAGRAYVGDTLLLIDISWPVPDGVSWELPEGATVISRTKDYAEITFARAGTYSMAMFCELAGCSASYDQVIEVEDRPVADVQSFVFAAPEEPMIQGFEVHPNPTTDRFTVQVSLKEESAVQLRLVDLEGNDIPYSETLKGSKEHAIRMDTRSLTPGMYFLQAEAHHEIKSIRLMVK